MRNFPAGSAASRDPAVRSLCVCLLQLICLLHNLHCEGKVWGTTPLTQNIVAKVLKNRPSAKTSLYFLSPNDTDASLLSSKDSFPTKAPRLVTPPTVTISSTSTSSAGSNSPRHDNPRARVNQLDDSVPQPLHRRRPDPLITFDAGATPPMLIQPAPVQKKLSSRAGKVRRPRPVKPMPANVFNDGPVAQPSEYRPGLSADRPERPRAAYKRHNASRLFPRLPQQLPVSPLNCPCMTTPSGSVITTNPPLAGNPDTFNVAASGPAQHQRPYVAGYSSSGMTTARSANMWSALSAQAVSEQRNSNNLFDNLPGVPANRDISGQISTQNSNWIPLPSQGNGMLNGQQATTFDSGSRNRVLESTADNMVTGNAWNTLPGPAPVNTWIPLPGNGNSFTSNEQMQQNSNRNLDNTAGTSNMLSGNWNPLPVGDPNQSGVPLIPDRQFNEMPTFDPRQTDTMPFFTTPSPLFSGTTTTPPQWMPFVPNWSTTRPPVNKVFQIAPPPPNTDTETRHFFTNELPPVTEGNGIQMAPPPPQTFVAGGGDGRVGIQDFIKDFQNGMFDSTFHNMEFNVDAESNRNKNLQSGTGNLVDNTNSLTPFDASMFTSTTPDTTTAQWSYSYPDMNTYQPTPEPATPAPLPPPQMEPNGGVPVCPPNASEAQPPITVDIIQPVRRIINLDSMVPICAQSVVSVVVDGGTPPGALLGTVLAQDPGASQLQWTLASDPTGRFAINSVTGEFGLSRDADLQGIDRTDVLVKATNPLNRQSCITLLHVKVRQASTQKSMSVPLVPPVAPTLASGLFKGMDIVFSHNDYAAEIPCSLPAGALVLRTEARSRVAGGVEYALRGTSEFIINATGFIFVQNLNISNKERVRSFHVVARDASGKQASSQVKLRLDTSTCYGPQFEMPLFIYDVSTDCSGLQPGDRIAEIKALPPSPSSRLQYGVVGAVIFSIDPTTGIITSGSAVALSQRLPDFGIVVTDTFGRTDSATVRVSVSINCTKPLLNATGSTENIRMRNDAPADKLTSPPEVFPRQRRMGQLGEYSIPVQCGTPARTEIGVIRPHALLGLEPKASLSRALTGLSLIGTEDFLIQPTTGAIVTVHPVPTFRTSLTFFIKAQDVRRQTVVKGKVTVKVVCGGKAGGDGERERATTVVTKWRGQRRKAWLASRPTAPTTG